MSLIVQATDSILTSNSGLAHIGAFLNKAKIKHLINRHAKVKISSVGFSDFDIIKCMIALIVLAKPSFESIEHYREDAFFKHALGLKKVPSAARFRQRVQGFSDHFEEVFNEINQIILSSADLKPLKINDIIYTLIRSDVTPFDNSGTKKEGVSYTYKGFNGFAPMISYIGEKGHMLNLEFREGSANSNCEGTLNYFNKTLEIAG